MQESSEVDYEIVFRNSHFYVATKCPICGGQSSFIIMRKRMNVVSWDALLIALNRVNRHYTKHMKMHVLANR